MGRPEPCVLFAQSFVHPHLDEYVDEIIFSEPVVITACEFIEQSASSASSLVTVVGATSPPSFALEVFVQSEGDARFRRLSQPFLYSHSSSNVLEVEAVVTNHLVVRGSYRSLSLVIYGNTAEDLGQFNVDFDLDSSLASLVSAPLEGRLEDLPSALRSFKLTLEESLCSFKWLTFPSPEIEIPFEVKKLLSIIHKLFLVGDFGDSFQKLAESIVSSVSSYVSSDLLGTVICCDPVKQGTDVNCKKDHQLVVAEAQQELLEVCKMLQHSSEDQLKEGSCLELNIESDAEQFSPKMLDVFLQCLFLKENSLSLEVSRLPQNERTILGLCLIFLFCHGRDGCFHFVNGGGLHEVCSIFSNEAQNSTAITLMLLGVVERATRHAIGCEGFLGWSPHEDESIPPASSEGYGHLVKLLLKQHRHDVASLVAFILHRLRFYEIASRYESAVMSVLAEFSTAGAVTKSVFKSLFFVDSLLKKLVKLLNLWEPVAEPLASAAKSFMIYEHEGILSYKSTVNLIATSKCSFAKGDIDTTLLSLLKERGFLLLSCALLSSPITRLENSSIMDLFVEITASIEAIMFSLLSSRSGLLFLLHHTEVAIALVLALKGTEEIDQAECIPLRYANILVAKGFICRTLEVGTITELHMKVVNAVDRLLAATPQTEECLWVLWELCTLSRSDAGRQALLALGRFPEAVSALIEALHSVKELPPDALSAGSSPINLAILHSAAEIFEVMVSDPLSSSLASWIDHAVELHKALHLSSPSSNWRDAPTRLLEWIDAGVVYQRSGAVGLLRYAAVLASGGDAHLSSASILVSDSIDVENVVGDSSGGSDVQIIENLLGKLVSDKYFEGIVLHESVIVQLTTAFRILAFIAENSSVAGALYEENAITVIYVIIVNCKFMLELSSGTYDYLVDEGPESNSVSSLLTERGREQSLIDLMIPTLSLLIILLQKLQEAKEPHQNTKLLRALLKLHKEVSPKLAASAPDMSSPYPRSSLGLGAVCRLIVSALASWPIFGWSPGLFLSLLESVQTSSQLALGPKEACSFLWILCDLFPEEDIWLWRSGIPCLSVLRRLSVAALFGEEKEAVIDWYLQPTRISVLLGRLSGFLDYIAQVVLHFAVSALSAMQDMLRILIIRFVSQKIESAVAILQPTVTWMHDCIVMSSSLPDTEIFKMGRLLEFISSLLEHPHSKVLLLKVDMVQVLTKALENCYVSFSPDGKHFDDGGVNLVLWFYPICKSLSLICDSREFTQYSKKTLDSVPLDNWACIARLLLKLCQILPSGKELLYCLVSLKGLASCSQGREALSLVLLSHTVTGQEKASEMDEKYAVTDEYDWNQNAPLFCCLKSLLEPLNMDSGVHLHTIESAKELLLCILSLYGDGKNVRSISVAKLLFGLSDSSNGLGDRSQEKLQDVTNLLTLLVDSITMNEHLFSQNEKTSIYQVKESIKMVLPMLQDPTHSIQEEKVRSGHFRSYQDVLTPTKLVAPHIRISSLDDESEVLLLRSERFSRADSILSLDGIIEQYLWECPDTSVDKLMMGVMPMKRKNASSEAPNRRARGESSMAEYIGANNFSRGTGGTSLPSGAVRRDTFRQRKPNTSRPPSMHVDDYVARERNFDGASGSGSVQRGISGGRPPSIHVDEFMARQRERQNPGAFPVAEVMAPQSGNSPTQEESVSTKGEKSRQLKADLDDEIDIVFDGEPETDDKLPFPPSDDPAQPAVLQHGESPRSIVEETESDQNGSSQNRHLSGRTLSDAEVESHEEFALRSERLLSREESLSSINFPPGKGKSYYHRQPDEYKHLNSSKSGMPPVSSVLYDNDSTLSPLPGGSRLPPVTFSVRESPKQAANISFLSRSPGPHDKSVASSQPPLPPFPPPTISSLHSQHAEHLRGQVAKNGPNPSSPYPFQTFEPTGPNGGLPTSSPFSDSSNHPMTMQLNADHLPSNISGLPLASVQPILDTRYAWASVSSSGKLNDGTSLSLSSRPQQPPLPPMPPPHSSQNSSSQIFPSNLSNHQLQQLQLLSQPSHDGRVPVSYSLPARTPPVMINRPSSSGGSLFAGAHTPQQQNQSAASPTPSLSNLQSAMLSVQSQPPSQPFRHQSPQHLKPSDQITILQQNPIHAQAQLLQPLQQLQMPHMQVYYQTQVQQQELVLQPQHQQQGDGGALQQQDSAATFQQFFNNPNALQSLINDKEKLCLLLEQHPKLMDMLQEKLGPL